MRIPKCSNGFWSLTLTILFCGTFAIYLMNLQTKHNQIMYHTTLMISGRAFYYGCRRGMEETGLLLSEQKGPTLSVPTDLANQLCQDMAVSYIRQAFPGSL